MWENKNPMSGPFEWKTVFGFIYQLYLGGGVRLLARFVKQLLVQFQLPLIIAISHSLNLVGVSALRKKINDVKVINRRPFC